MAKSGSNKAGAATPSVRTILLVDDLDECRVATKWFLGSFGYSVETVPSAEDALSVFDPNVHNVVVTDNSMSGMTGVELAHIIKLRSRSTPVILFSSNVPEDASCLDLVVQRPTHLMALKEGVDRLLK